MNSNEKTTSPQEEQKAMVEENIKQDSTAHKIRNLNTLQKKKCSLIDVFLQPALKYMYIYYILRHIYIYILNASSTTSVAPLSRRLGESTPTTGGDDQ